MKTGYNTYSSTVTGMIYPIDNFNVVVSSHHNPIDKLGCACHGYLVCGDKV